MAKVFGWRALKLFRSEMTLLEATQEEEGVENVFPYSAWEVKTLLIQTLVSEEAAHFSIANDACN